MRNRIQDILYRTLEFAHKNKFRSNDISDLLNSNYYIFSRRIKPVLLGRILLYPYNRLVKSYPHLIRKFIKNRGAIYPQGQAMLVRAMVSLINSGNELGNIQEVERIANWLKKSRSLFSDNYGWGQPFLWYSSQGVIFPINIPRSTVSSQVAWAFIDLYEVTQNNEYLEIAKSVCRLFIDNFNYQEDTNGNIAFSYTTIDNYHVHNASMLAASVLSRVYRLTDIEEYRTYAKKAIDFTISHQNEDGSFYYWAPPNEVNYVIDNYHTGFVLECLKTIIEDFNKDEYTTAYQRGLNFYYDNLFEGAIPKLTPKSTYPIDIQSCAQSIITLSKDGRDKYLNKAIEIAEYTIENFFLEDKNHFAYRIYKNGIRDESYYFRWGDSWMIKALALLNEKKICLKK